MGYVSPLKKVERNLKIYSERERGRTFAEIGIEFGISNARVQQIHRAIKRVIIKEIKQKRLNDE